MATARVLIVDDVPLVLRLVSKAVEGWGYESCGIQCTAGTEACS